MVMAQMSGRAGGGGLGGGGGLRSGGGGRGEGGGGPGGGLAGGGDLQQRSGTVGEQETMDAGPDPDETMMVEPHSSPPARTKKAMLLTIAAATRFES